MELVNKGKEQEIKIQCLQVLTGSIRWDN